MNIQEMRDELVQISDSAQEIKKAGEEAGSYTEEQAAQVKTFLNRAEELKGMIADAERSQQIDDLSDFVSKPVQKVLPPSPQNSLVPSQQTVQPVTAPQAAMRISAPGHHGGLKVYNRGQEDLVIAYRIGRFFDAMFNRNPKSIRWCNENGVRYMNQQIEGVNTAGGVFVPDEMSQRIIDLRDSYGVYRANALIEPMASSSKTINRRKNGLQAYHVGERKSTERSKAEWIPVNLVARKVSVYAAMSEELEEDSIVNMADLLTDEAAYAMAVREDADGFNGDGTSTSGGITGLMVKIIDGNHGAGAVPAASGHNTFASLDITDIVNLMSALPEVARRRGQNKWYMSSYAYDQVVGRLSLGGGGNTIGDYSQGWRPVFQGYPVELTETLPGAGTHGGQGMLAYGSIPLASTMGSRRTMTVKMSEHVLFDTDETALKFQERYDIVWHDLGDANKAGPVVVLVGTD